MEFTFGDHAALYHHFTGSSSSSSSRREMVRFELWPVEHPLEPLDEDTPIKCPLPASSPINVEQGAAELATVRVRMHGAAPVRAVRKRQHTLIGTEQGKARVAPLPPIQPHNTSSINDFQMLREVDESLGLPKE